jgi:hypothetical protein
MTIEINLICEWCGAKGEDALFTPGWPVADIIERAGWVWSNDDGELLCGECKGGAKGDRRELPVRR